jgi:hypothetical protein
MISSVSDGAGQIGRRFFGDIYSKLGRPFVTPGRLLHAVLIQAFISIRFEL